MVHQQNVCCPYSSGGKYFGDGCDDDDDVVLGKIWFVSWKVVAPLALAVSTCDNDDVLGRIWSISRM